eukprot:5544423-Lingulodinium_polyedra.AAC.1
MLERDLAATIDELGDHPDNDPGILQQLKLRHAEALGAMLANMGKLLANMGKHDKLEPQETRNSEGASE